MNHELYQQVILEHNKKPRNFLRLEQPTHSAEGLNPVCGDHFWVDLKVSDGVVEEIGFQGSGCAISKASASMMTVQVKGKAVEEALSIVDHFLKLLKDGEPDARVGSLKIFAGVHKFPARVKCAALSWRTFESAVKGKGVASTESKEGFEEGSNHDNPGR